MTPLESFQQLKPKIQPTNPRVYRIVAEHLEHNRLAMAVALLDDLAIQLWNENKRDEATDVELAVAYILSTQGNSI